MWKRWILRGHAVSLSLNIKDNATGEGGGAIFIMKQNFCIFNDDIPLWYKQ